VEIIDLGSSSSACPNLPDTTFAAEMKNAAGGIGFQSEPMVCEGVYDDSVVSQNSGTCYHYVDQQWQLMVGVNRVTPMVSRDRFYQHPFRPKTFQEKFYPQTLD
jgi:hypothetical protein